MSSQAQQWARERLTVRNLTQVRSRPWAEVWRVEAAEGRWWLKVNAAGTTYEPRLLVYLAEFGSMLVPDCIVHAYQPWSLIADAGGPLPANDSADRGTHVAFWCRLLGDYAKLQRATSARGRPAIGLPDFSPEQLLERFDEVLDDPVWFGPEAAPELTPAQLARIRRARPALQRAARRLGDGLPPAVQHNDLHANNVLVPSDPTGSRPLVGRVIDWGDAVWAHPFGTLLITQRSLATAWGVTEDGVALRRIREAYLAPWRTSGESHADLKSQLALAVRTAGLARATACIRALGTVPAGLSLGHADAPSTWMLRLAEALGVPE